MGDPVTSMHVGGSQIPIYLHSELVCNNCNSVAFRWSPSRAPLGFYLEEILSGKVQRIFGCSWDLFRLCCEIGKSSNAIKARHPSKDEFYVDIGTRHILRYNKLVGIESFGK